MVYVYTILSYLSIYVFTVKVNILLLYYIMSVVLDSSRFFFMSYDSVTVKVTDNTILTPIFSSKIK